MTLGVLQTTCGALTVACLVALGQPPTAIAAHDGTTPLARTYAAIPTAWDPGGPLAIPTIGVVPPGLEDWFDPEAPRPFPATTGARPTPTVTAPATRSPVRSVDDSAAAPRSPATSGSIDPTPTEAPQGSTSPAGAAPAGTTSQETTAVNTTAPATTSATTTSPDTTAPSTTTPSSTSATTSTLPATTSPTATDTPPPTDEPAPTPPTTEANGRGNVVLGLGEQLTVLDAETGALVLSIGVDSVSAEVTCTDPHTSPAADGHLIAVQVQVTTGSGLAAVGAEPAVRAADFSFLGPDGGTLSSVGTPVAESCIPDSEAFPAGPLGTDREFAGIVALDVPAITGTLVYAPAFLPVGGEWTY